ncbi:hypothetical protein [Okeania sp. KiyG1]|uniref:hypothetical protein n=1 Tax=Okeania sp. KiyG1 TaxID=2720165 RepID=UPI0019205993|nr:hypothetical protein [Okeania sp. KiyG1]
MRDFPSECRSLPERYFSVKADFFGFLNIDSLKIFHFLSFAKNSEILPESIKVYLTEIFQVKADFFGFLNIDILIIFHFLSFTENSEILPESIKVYLTEIFQVKADFF